MRYRTLGRTGFDVSTISLGSWLTYGGAVADETAIACIRRAFDLGVNLFDTANNYERGGAERLLGRALEPLPRDGYFVATKVYSPVGPGPEDRGLGRTHVLAQCDASLQRLGVDAIDLYQCHRYDAETPLEETCRVMDELVRAGKIRHWGVSRWSPAQLEEAAALCEREGLAGPSTDQSAYSLVDRHVERGVLDACQRLGLGFLAYSPLAQGMLTGKYRPREAPAGTRGAGPRGRFMAKLMTPETFATVERLRAAAAELGITPAQLALAWVLRRDVVTTAIVGATSPEQVAENVAAADVEVDEATAARLEGPAGAEGGAPRGAGRTVRRWLRGVTGR
jgi:aryl-alcohol dehydrogenase-like predicted oxidoreductase